MGRIATPATGVEKSRIALDRAVIRFAGDSGDGMQLTGEQFTTESAWAGNDIATLPNFPAEIRAPAGTLFGVSSFQLQFGSQRVYTPGDRLDCLVAMNPAALKVHLRDLKPGGLLLVNTAAFDKRNLDKAGYAQNPLDDPALAERYRLHKVDMTGLTHEAIKDLALNTKEKDRTKNFFALGLVSWIYTRPLEPTLDWINKKFAKSMDIAEAHTRVLKAGHAFGETAEIFGEHYTVDAADMAPGLYRAMTGNRALAWGILAAAQRSRVPVVYGAYPITPASDILHELAMHKRFGGRTIQAEDGITAVTAAIGASFGGAIGVTGSSGPGIALKSEGIGLAVTAELPLVVLNIQRAGPSTGMPTKTEQADLMQALYGRNSESPVAVLAPATPGDCFYVAYEAVRIAAKYMMPVIVLSDGFLANGSEPWLIPDVNTLPPIEIQFRTSADGFFPYLRDPATLARPWVRPGTPGLEHRIGGIEKQDVTGNISYDPENHDHMVKTRAEKVRRVAQEIPPTTINGEATGDLLVVGWGGTYGAITAAVERAQTEGRSVASVHLRHLNPLPPDLDIPSENIVFISGIGCSSRFPYYMNTYGFHTIHGRAPAIATGLKLARPDLKIFVVTGDGDGLSIGGNHLLHVLRRNVDLTVLLFNNRIYGLTKGQYSPTSEQGKVTKSTPMGSADRPVYPVAFALGCGATFVARTVDRHIAHMEETIKRAAAHKGTAFVEILQNCNVYNDLAWNVMYDKEQRLQYELRLEPGKPLLFGPQDDRRAVIMDGVRPKVVTAKDVPASALWVHDESNVNAAKLLADLFAPDFPVPIGVLAAVAGPVYEEIMLDQEQKAISERGPGDIAKLLTSGDTWRIS